MKVAQKFRGNGAIGAMLDEYERSIAHLKDTIANLSSEKMAVIVDHQTTDPDCKSIQTVLSHVVSSGYTYVIAIRKHMGEELDYKNIPLLNSVKDYNVALDEMFQSNVLLFEDYPDMQIEEHENNRKIKVRWGQYYDAEQLLEHAIVHILRHRRQIEKFIRKLDLGG